MVNININPLQKWLDYTNKAENLTKKVNILVAGKYSKANDCYKSLFEAIYHAGIENDVKCEIIWCDTKTLNKDNIHNAFKDINGVIVPGGFGVYGTDGKIEIIKYSRENNISFLGICYGMHFAVIEFVRNVLNIQNANSTEVDPNTANKIVGLITEWQKNDGSVEIRNKNSQIGGTMRLGEYKSRILPNTLAYQIYNSLEISERHRHRYEINHNYINMIEEAGGLFSAFSSNDNKLPEIFEIPNHKFFISCQFHPELKSRPFNVSKIFSAFIKKTINV